MAMLVTAFYTTMELQLAQLIMIMKVNCAAACMGAWWYANCHDSNLNGYNYGTSDPTPLSKRHYLAKFYHSLSKFKMGHYGNKTDEC